MICSAAAIILLVVKILIHLSMDLVMDILIPILHQGGMVLDLVIFFQYVFFGGDSGSGFNINDLFGGAKGGRASRRGYRPERQSYDSELNITLEEGYKGTTKSISLNFGGQRKKT